MFGYVQPLKPELKVKEFALYRGYYCGVCKVMGKLYGLASRFTVTYDAAFLALINSALFKDEENMALERCVVNPLKPKPIVSEDPTVKYAAAVNLIMAYYKLKDGWQDEKSILSLLVSWILSPSAGRIMSAHPEMCQAVVEQLSRLATLEAGKATSIDEAAHPFAKLVSTVLPAPHVQGKQRRVMEWLGYNLGKWVYIVDAYCDIESDIASGSYNVLAAKYGKDVSHLFSSSVTTTHINGQQREKMDTSTLLFDYDTGYICKRKLDVQEDSVLSLDGRVAFHQDEGNEFGRWREEKLHSWLKEEIYGEYITKGGNVGQANDATFANEGKMRRLDGQGVAGELVCRGLDNGRNNIFAWQDKGERLYQKGDGKSLATYIREKSRGEVEFILNACLAEIGKAYELLDIKKNGRLLENIIYLGLPYKTQMVLNERGEGNGSIQGFGRKAWCNTGGNKGGL